MDQACSCWQLTMNSVTTRMASRTTEGVMQLMIQYGGNVDALNIYDETPIQVTKSDECLRILKEASTRDARCALVSTGIHTRGCH
jgi:hypothetical protein